MRFLDPDGMVSLIGLLAQTGVTWILTLIFALLLRPSGRPGFFVDWTRGLMWIAVGLTAVSLRFYVPLMVPEWQADLRDDGSLTRVLLAVYQLGKCFGAVYILRGALRLTRGLEAALRRGWLVPAAAGYAIVTAALSDEVEQVLFWQSLVCAPVLFASGALLWRRPRERRDQGVRITATALQLNAALWVVYGLLTASHLAGMQLITQRGSAFHTALSYNSYFDLALTVATAAGMIVLLMLDLQRASRAAQEERARLELQLERGERLRSLGTLVSSVAHDLNNPLTAVLGFAAELERARQGTEDEQPARIVREQAERCRSIVQRLSSLVGDHPMRRRLVDPVEVAERVVRGARPRFAEAGVGLEFAVHGELPALYADPFGLEEVLDNLLDNALQASVRGGRASLELGLEQEMVAFRVRDEGKGVPEQLRARIFDPFFTLRTDGKGTGLGLSVARGIVKAHAGRLELEETSGRPGASFLVLLPPARAEALPLRTGDLAQSGAVPGARGLDRRVLVVDDERLVRKVLRRWLHREGWLVEEREDGAEALELLRREPAGFAAVLCDLRMPHMTGYALHDRLARELPEALERTIFITGDLASPEAAEFSARCTRPIVRKPFDFDELAAALAAAGEAARPAVARSGA